MTTKHLSDQKSVSAVELFIFVELYKYYRIREQSLVDDTHLEQGVTEGELIRGRS